MEKAERARQRAARQVVRDQEKALRALKRARQAKQRAARESEKERRRLHQEARAAEVEAMNADIEARLSDLSQVLQATLEVDDHIDFESLKVPFKPAPFSPGRLAKPAKRPHRPPEIPGLSFLKRLRKKNVELRDRAIQEQQEAYRTELESYARAEKQRTKSLDASERQHAEIQEGERLRVEQAHAEIDQFRHDFESGDPKAVVEYFGLVLQASIYPDGFPRHSRVAFVPESRQLVIEIELPGLDVVPELKKYKYVKARDDISEAARSAAEIRRIYADLIAQVTLRTIHEVFGAERGRNLETVVLNGIVEAIDPATGREVTPCLVSVRTTEPAFAEIDLSRVEPIACLKALNASVSAKPAELAPVRPVLEFSMVDNRFIEETDVLSELDQRINLMEMTPTGFEGLISNLFERMGLETRQTRPSRDGGVDCVAFDPRPIFGGKVVIQAKRYKNTVGVSAVRDLFGTVQNEGASKGILVTTSGYGKSSFEFANGKPLELLDGPNLLYLLAEHAGLEAKIEPPEGWRDPMPDLNASGGEGRLRFRSRESG